MLSLRSVRNAGLFIGSRSTAKTQKADKSRRSTEPNLYAASKLLDFSADQLPIWVFLVSQLRFSAMHGTAKYSCKYLIEYLLLNYLLSAGFVYGKPI